MTMPNFLIIGAAKAGTTSLYRYLQQHPQIYMSPHKEPRFFALEGQPIDFQGPGDRTRFNFVTDLDSYRALFEQVTDEIAIGEASPWYLYVPQAPERIKHHIPNAKLIAMLREPVARAYSNYLHALREELEPLNDFTQAMEVETERINNNWSYRWHYKQKGFYYLQLKRYFDLFDRNQIGIYLYDDFVREPFKTLQNIFDFLGVDRDFVPNFTEKHNLSAMPKSKSLEEFLTRSNKIKTVLSPLLPSVELRRRIKNNLLNINLRPKPKLQPEVKSKFIAEYREDILKLQELIDRDLFQWLEI